VLQFRTQPTIISTGITRISQPSSIPPLPNPRPVDQRNFAGMSQALTVAVANNPLPLPNSNMLAPGDLIQGNHAVSTDRTARLTT